MKPQTETLIASARSCVKYGLAMAVAISVVGGGDGSLFDSRTASAQQPTLQKAPTRSYQQNGSRTFADNERRIYPGNYLGAIRQHPRGPQNIGSLSQVGLVPYPEYASKNARGTTDQSTPTILTVNEPKQTSYHALTFSCGTARTTLRNAVRLNSARQLRVGAVSALARCATDTDFLFVLWSKPYSSATVAQRSAVAPTTANASNPSLQLVFQCPPGQTLFINNVTLFEDKRFLCGYERVDFAPVPSRGSLYVIEVSRPIPCLGRVLLGTCVEVPRDASSRQVPKFDARERAPVTR